MRTRFLPNDLLTCFLLGDAYNIGLFWRTIIILRAQRETDWKWDGRKGQGEGWKCRDAREEGSRVRVDYRRRLTFEVRLLTIFCPFIAVRIRLLVVQGTSLEPSCWPFSVYLTLCYKVSGLILHPFASLLQNHTDAPVPS